MSEKIGIDNLKKLLSYGFKSFKGTKTALADGKVNLMDVDDLLPVVTGAPSAYKALLKAHAEIADMDETERNELNAYAKTLVQDGILNDAQIEDLIVDTLMHLLDTYKLAERYGDIIRA